jgi:hypothetical protein
MFRTTFVTGDVVIGDAIRQVTAFIDHDTNAVDYRTVAGASVPVTQSTMWKTLRSTRNAAAARLHSDRRFSAAGPQLFAFSASKITDKKGNIMGRTERTVPFIEHMLTVSGESTWRGETQEDRKNDAAILIAAITVA